MKKNPLTIATFYFLTASSFIACTPALPTKETEPELKKYLQQIEESSRKTEQLLIDARVERETSQKLLQEARRLAEKAQAAENACRQLVAEVKLKPPKKVYIIKKVPVEPVAVSTAPERDAGKEAEKKPEATPNHSASDAP